jgi:putative hemolysin
MTAAVGLAGALALGLAAAAFFAACEGAWVALTAPGHPQHAAAAPSATRAARLLARSARAQHAIAFGHLAAIAWTGTIAWLAAASRFGQRPVEPLSLFESLALLGVVAFVLHVVGEQTPKALTVEAPQEWARRTAVPLAAWHLVLWPVTSLAAGLARVAARVVGSGPPLDEVTTRDVRSLVAETSERAELEADERQMITSIFAFGDTTAREVMTPRTDVFALPVDTPVTEALRRVREAEHSRVPLYREGLDSVVGVVYAKDLLAIAHGIVPPPPSLGSLVRDATFVPEAKKIDDLLREFQRERIHMAVVVDEYGGTAGILTLEDILEELVGEIQDEYDQEPPLVVPLEDGAFRVDGRLDADDFSELTGEDLIGDGVETLGGLVARELGRVPAGGESVRIGAWTFLVEGVEGKRVTRLKAWREPTASSEEEEEE